MIHDQTNTPMFKIEGFSYLSLNILSFIFQYGVQLSLLIQFTYLKNCNNLFKLTKFIFFLQLLYFENLIKYLKKSL